ncbi:hypothetical protein YC2023_115554 [Brassica napus]
MGYFSAVAPGTRTLARGIFSTPSYPKKTGTPCTTPFGLILGPDSPSVDEPCGGTLGFSGHWILTMFALLKPTFSLPLRPPPLARLLSP